MANLARALEEAAQSGPNFGYPTVNLAASLESIEWTTESTEAAATAAVSEAFQEALRGGGGNLLEPILRFEVRTPADFLSGVLNDLQGGAVWSTSSRSRSRCESCAAPSPRARPSVHDCAPLAFAGRAAASLEPARYAIVPDKIRREVTGA